MNRLNSQQTARSVIFLLPFFLYEELLLAAALFVAGMVVIRLESLGRNLQELDWRDYLFFLYLFHMLFGERNFAYVGFEPIFVTEVVLAILLLAWRREIFRVHSNLLVYYILVGIGLLWGLAYLQEYRVSALRDALMLVYAIWVPLIYHIFRRKRSYDLFFVLLKLFIVLKAAAYIYEGSMILTGQRAIVFEGFRFNVGYVMPSLIVVSLFLPFRRIGLPYKLLSLVMIPAVFTLFHRSIFLGLFLAVGFIFLVGRPVIRRMILTYGTATLVVLSGFLVYYNSQIEVDLFRVIEQKVQVDEGNINFRMISWQYVLENYADYPLLGFGVGQPIMYVEQNRFYSTIDLDYFDIRDLGGNAQPHNSYLNVLARFGIVIIPLMLYALWLPLRRVLLLTRRQRAGDHYLRLLLLSALLLIMYVFAFFNVVLESPHHAFPFWLAVAMLLAWDRPRNSPPKRLRLEPKEGGS